MSVICIAAALLAAYLIGSIPFGFLIGKYNGVDIRKVGSCNIGATNVTRSVGKLQGRLCFACDFLKGFLPTLAASGIFCSQPWVVLAVAAAAVCGHMFPVYLGFKGGKGVSTAAGALLAVTPWAVLFAIIVWMAVFFISRYVSLASIAAALALVSGAWVSQIFEIGPEISRSIVTAVFSTLLGVLAIIRHRGNIVRLLNGTENRFSRK